MHLCSTNVSPVTGFLQENQNRLSPIITCISERSISLGWMQQFVIYTTPSGHQSLTQQNTSNTVHSDCFAVKGITIVNTSTERILWKQGALIERIILRISISNNKSALIFLCNTFQILKTDATALKEHEKSVLACAQIFLTGAGWLLLRWKKFYDHRKKP